MKKIISLLLVSALTFPALADGVLGSGRGVPLSMAISSFVPKNIRVTYAYNVDGQKKINWSGDDRTWKVVLDEIASREGLVITQKGNEIRISAQNPNLNDYIRDKNAPNLVNNGTEYKAYNTPENKNPQTGLLEKPANDVLEGPGFTVVMPPKERTFETNVTRNNGSHTVQNRLDTMGQPPVISVTTEAPRAETPIVPVRKVIDNRFVVMNDGNAPLAQKQNLSVKVNKPYIVSAGSDLKTVLEEWAKREGWTVVWELKAKYELLADAEFYGDFSEATAQLVNEKVMGEDTPYLNFFNGNKYLFVSDKPIIKTEDQIKNQDSAIKN